MRRFRGGVLLLALILLVVCLCFSCEYQIEDYYSQYCILEPFEGNYAQVTFKTSDMIYPPVCTIDGKEYIVAVINGFENPEDARALTGALEIKDGIMAVNSNAFAGAENVSEVFLPTSCQSLGVNSLPPQTSEITLNPEAAKDIYSALSDTSNLKFINIMGNGATSISGSFSALEKVQIIGESATAQAYWPSLPSFSNTATRYFAGWYDAQGNRIVSGSGITKANTTVTINGREYYLYGAATPRFTEKETEEQVAGGSGFDIPYFMVATADKYSFVFTDYGAGNFGIAPKTTENTVYSLTFDLKEVKWELDNGEWKITVDQPGTYVFSCFYKTSDGTVEGYGQISFRYGN